MAGPAHSDHHRGEMEISEQKATFALFMNLAKWGSLHVAAALLFLTVAFATKAGFMAAAFAFVVLEVLGFLFLKNKPDAGAAH